MERFTISLDDQLAKQFEQLVNDKRYASRSEAVRDLIRYGLSRAALGLRDCIDPASECIATVSFVRDARDSELSARLQAMKVVNQSVVVASGQTLFERANCVETMTLRGTVAMVRETAERFLALRGVRHGSVNLAPLDAGEVVDTRWVKQQASQAISNAST